MADGISVGERLLLRCCEKVVPTRTEYGIRGSVWPIKWKAAMRLRDREARLLERSKSVLNCFVVAAVLVCAVVLSAINKTKLNFAFVADCYPIQYCTEFRKMQ
jgi:hypothetical protein